MLNACVRVVQRKKGEDELEAEGPDGDGGKDKTGWAMDLGSHFLLLRLLLCRR